MTNSIAKPNQSKLIFRQLFDKDTGTFTYFLFDSETMEGRIIDPVKEQFDLSLQFIEELGVELIYVNDTHVHADHVTSSNKSILVSTTSYNITINS